MPRTLSNVCAASQLLRNLDDLRSICRNPLVAHLLAAATPRHRRHTGPKLKALVFAAIESVRDPGSGKGVPGRGNRQYEIIARYDLGGESRSKIAADLGIAQSKFYGERRKALCRIADFLSREKLTEAGIAVSRPPMADVTDEADDPEDFAAKLRAAGQPGLAVRVLEQHIGCMPVGMKRTMGLCQLVATLCDETRGTDAAHAYSEARSTLEAVCTENKEHARLLLAEVDFAALQLSWHHRNVEECLKLTAERR